MLVEVPPCPIQLFTNGLQFRPADKDFFARQFIQVDVQTVFLVAKKLQRFVGLLRWYDHELSTQ